MSEYKLTIRDKDGEVYEYAFFADYPLEVTEYVLNCMRQKGNFFGHEHLKTQDVGVSQLVDGTLLVDAVDLRVWAKDLQNARASRPRPKIG